MASLYHPRYPSGAISRYWNAKCSPCKKRWGLRYPDGRRVVDRRDAFRYKAEHELACPGARNGQHYMSLSQLIARYLEATRERRTPRDQQDGQQKATRLSRYLGASPVSDLCPSLIQDTLRAMQRDYPKMGLPRRDKYLIFLRAVANWGVKVGRCVAEDFTQGLTKMAPAGTRGYLPMERAEEFLQLARASKYWLGCLTMLDTGVRPSELSQLEAGDLDLSERILTVRAEVSKTRQARYIGLTDRLTQALKEGVPKEGRAFRYYWPRFSRQVTAWLRRMGIEGQRLGGSVLIW